MSDNPKIIYDEFTNVVVDVEKIQAKPTMYISYTGARAYLHLVLEAIANCIDEYKNKNNIGDGIVNIFYDEAEGEIYIEDSGRGIQFDQLENSCTIIHSGTKIVRKGQTAGENGVGLTAINALSEEFTITSFNNGRMKMITFRNGKKVSENESKSKSNKHGLLVAFKPSKIFLGSSCVLDIPSLEDWLLKQSFMQPEFIKFNLTVNMIGKDATLSKTFQNTKGFGGFIPRLEPDFNLIKTPIVLSGNDKISETIHEHQDDGRMEEVTLERNIDLTITFNYNPDVQDTVRYSFCNDIETIEHGEHVNGVMNGMITFFRKKFKEENANSKRKEDNVDVTNNDILFGLCLVVRMNTEYSTGLFTGQTKHKMDNRIFYEPVRKMTIQILNDYFNLPENKKTLNRIFGMIRENIKARLAVSKVKKDAKNNRKSLMEASLIDGYTPPNLLDEAATNKDIKLELYIIEGKSAGGTCRTGRYSPKVQGTLGLTGKPNNIYGWSDEKVQKDAPDLHSFFNDILGCGYGKHFNIDNLIYDKILCMPDADVDGDHIMGVLVADIYDKARPLIEQGHVYRVITPLYKLMQRENQKRIDRNQYLYSKDEFFSIYEERASSIIKLKFDLNDKDFVSRANMKRFLQTNRDYYEALDTISSHYTIHPDIVEFIAANVNDFRNKIGEFCPTMVYNSHDDSIKGDYDNTFYNLIIDDIFIDQVKYLNMIIHDGNNDLTHYHTFKKYKTKKDPDYLGYLSIGQIMLLCQDQEPELESRYKGQGELTPEQMNVLAMNPESRRLIRMTITDVEETTKVMTNLFAKECKDVRKQLVRDADIHVDDIDN